MENYGHWGFPGEFLHYGGQADKVAGIFLYENPNWDLGPLECRAASSAAHLYGKTKVDAEAFTARFNFRQYPAIMKTQVDLMFCEGITYFVSHEYIHQAQEALCDRLVRDEVFPYGFPGRSLNQPCTFTTTKIWNAESNLLPSGLLDPVKILVEKEMAL